MKRHFSFSFFFSSGFNILLAIYNNNAPFLPINIPYDLVTSLVYRSILLASPTYKLFLYAFNCLKEQMMTFTVFYFSFNFLIKYS